MKTNERILRNESCSACMTDRKKTDALVTLVETSQSDEELGPARADRAVLEDDGHAAGLQRGAHRAAHVDVGVALAALVLVALRLQPALELRDDAVHAREVLKRAASAARGRARSAGAPAAAPRCARSGGARARGAAAARSGGCRRAAGRRGAGRARGSCGCSSERRPSWRRMRCTSTPITPEPSPCWPKAAIARRARSRRALSLPSAIAWAIWQPQRLEVQLRAGLVHAAAAGRPRARPPGSAASSAARKKKRSKTRSKIAPVVRRLGERRRRAPRGTRPGSVHSTSGSAANESSSSLVPTATPSPRSSSANSRMCAARPSGTASCCVPPKSAARREVPRGSGAARSSAASPLRRHRGCPRPGRASRRRARSRRRGRCGA